ncbi:DNA repair protein RecO [Corynebacterium coyleae]|uniref:DNA repair protein RecO n=1 Tax=Corynebacterium coyleae TaxID=53374 RepID=UPI00254D217D|nr:DNA repair protein RecO [Corynebacterium coyleae]MDK8823330.1 DNA repair protein RecO [Corynebacterium coyleae]
MASRPSWRDRAFVVRTYDFGEADRVVVLLTRNHGLVRGVAKGVRKVKSRFGSRLQPFVDVDVQVYPGRGLSTITGADTVTYYGARIIDDFDRYAAACAVMEAAEKLSYDQGDPELFGLVQEALTNLQTDQHPTLVLDAFMLKATEHAGWGLSLFNCANCQAPGPHKAFNTTVGGAVCNNCRPTGSMDVNPETLHDMWLLRGGYGVSSIRVAQIHRATVAHVQHNLEAGLKSLKIMEQA